MEIPLLFLGFITSLSLFILVAKRNIAFAMFLAAFILGLFTLPFDIIFNDLVRSFIDPSVISLALATSLIPVIGGLMNDTGLMEDMVKNLKISERSFLGLAPAMFGMLPMPGGALLSAPLVERIGEDKVSKEIKATANVWFRHIFVLIYPMSAALIISTEVSGIDMYVAISHLVLFSAFSALLGYLFYLRSVPPRLVLTDKVSIKLFLKPFSVLVLAPVVDFSIKNYGPIPLKPYATLTAVSSSLILLIIMTRVEVKDIYATAKRMRAWDFFFLIIFINFYLYVFLDSGLAEAIRGIKLDPFTMFVAIPFSLGFLTGRVVTPASILYPIYIAKLGSVTPLIFTITYVSIFMGYIISPVHPCLVLTAKYFEIDIKEITLRGAIPAILVSLVAAMLLFL